ncbi:MAG: ASKHA domain-containing protein [Candidatus Bathyarchaeota archaeon]|nr:ASKHA domain-containing protein [Candidatus Bathyarchaeota archaeon]
MDTMSFEVIFQPDGKRDIFKAGTTLLEAARSLGVDINSVCGGAGACGKCIIRIISGKTSPPVESEYKYISETNIENGYRLACLQKIVSDMVVLVPEESRTGTQRLQTEGLDTPVTLDPVATEQGLGFAADIGSTKLAGYLLDLSNGEVLTVSTEMNPQIPYGEDIITRITNAIQKPRNNQVLHEALVDGIRKLINDACIKTERDPEDIKDTVLVGNTAMQHFILGIDLHSLSRNPFMPENLAQRNLPQETLNLAPKSPIYIPPLIAGFVGADCVAATLATGLHEAEETSFLMDIGTNTEIVIGDKNKLVACSCASGPAFEGAHIKYGMRAATGAIEGVWINPETLEPSIRTIDNGTPIGLCGSGLIDLLAEMLKTGIMDSTGRLNRIDHPRLREHNSVYEYVVAWGDEPSHDIAITQLDIRELQKGKAAIYSGAYVAMNRLNLTPRDIKNVYIAGAFGTYIDKQSATLIGMIPEFPQNNIQQVGNAAGTGARMMLLSRKAREEAENIPKQVEYIELATSPSYNKEYIDALMLPHRNLARFPETTMRLDKTGWVKGKLHG